MRSVTLILGLSQPEGIYLSVDYRITDSRSGSVIDDAATKHLTIHYAPIEGGPRALLAYTGVAILPDGTPTGTWIRETLRGESEEFDVSMRHLVERLNRDFGPLGHGLIINYLVMHGERRYCGGTSNLRRAPKGRTTVGRRFQHQLQELTEPFVFRNGSGAMSRATPRQVERLHRQLGIPPRRPKDYMNLLAIANREIAAKEKTVSPYCHVAFLNSAEYKFGPESHTFTERGESVPFGAPMLFAGIDLSDSTTRFMESSQEFFAGRIDSIPEQDADQMNEELKRRP